MNVRLIKPDRPRIEEEPERTPVEVPMIDSIRSWVDEFRAIRANRARLDFEQVCKTGKT